MPSRLLFRPALRRGRRGSEHHPGVDYVPTRFPQTRENKEQTQTRAFPDASKRVFSFRLSGRKLLVSFTVSALFDDLGTQTRFLLHALSLPFIAPPRPPQSPSTAPSGWRRDLSFLSRVVLRRSCREGKRGGWFFSVFFPLSQLLSLSTAARRLPRPFFSFFSSSFSS